MEDWTKLLLSFGLWLCFSVSLYMNCHRYLTIYCYICYLCFSVASHQVSSGMSWENRTSWHMLLLNPRLSLIFFNTSLDFKISWPLPHTRHYQPDHEISVMISISNFLLLSRLFFFLQFFHISEPAKHAFFIFSPTLSFTLTNYEQVF